MNKRIGDWVKRGEILVRIDDAEYQQATAEAEANLKIARASLAEAASQITLAKQELERVQSLQEKGIASPAELDAALTNHQAQQSRLELATAQVEQREAALASAKIRLSYTVLAASQPGYIGERYIDEGSLLAPNTPVFMVIGIDSVIVRTTIVERDYGSIKIGQPCQVRVDAFSDKPFTGRVSHIAPMLQQESRMAQMELIVANSDHLLKPGMFARVQVRIAEKEQAQVVPSAALVRRNGQQGVFVLEQDKPEVRYMPVTVGIFNNEWAEITSPAIQGQVVTLGQHLLEDGSQVILPKTVGENSAVPRSQVKE
jgi:RND family efflux transporter MFP subunit